MFVLKVVIHVELFSSNFPFLFFPCNQIHFDLRKTIKKLRKFQSKFNASQAFWLCFLKVKRKYPSDPVDQIKSAPNQNLLSLFYTWLVL